MLQSGEVDFLRAELRAGLTFSHIALQSKSESKVTRNRLNARKAYNTLMRYSSESVLSREVEFAELLAKLKSNLLRLGETL